MCQQTAIQQFSIWHTLSFHPYLQCWHHRSTTAKISFNSRDKNKKILGLYQIWLYEIRPKPDLAGFRNSSPAGAGFGGTYVRVTETNGINNTVGFCKETAQFSASFDVTVFDQICGTAINLVFFSVQVTLINSPCWHGVRLDPTPSFFNKFS